MKLAYDIVSSVGINLEYNLQSQKKNSVDAKAHRAKVLGKDIIHYKTKNDQFKKLNLSTSDKKTTNATKTTG